MLVLQVPTVQPQPPRIHTEPKEPLDVEDFMDTRPTQVRGLVRFDQPCCRACVDVMGLQ